MQNDRKLKENTGLLFSDRSFQIRIIPIRTDTYNILHTHWHEDIEILYVRRGSAVFYLGDRQFEVSPEDILFVNSGMLHSGYSINNTNVSFYAMVINRSLLSSTSGDPGYAEFIAPFADGRLNFPDKVGRDHKDHQEIKGIIDAIIKELKQKKEGYELAVKAHLQLLVLTVYRKFVKAPGAKPASLNHSHTMDNLKKLITHIEESYHEKLTVRDAAKIVNLSQYHFCKTFKKLTGRTFIEFLNLYRVNKAEELLRSTDIPVTLIAERVGFCNINYFDRVFRLYKRYSPSYLRKQ